MFARPQHEAYQGANLAEPPPSWRRTVASSGHGLVALAKRLLDSELAERPRHASKIRFEQQLHVARHELHDHFVQEDGCGSKRTR